MDQKEIEKLAEAAITRPGFKKLVSGEIARQLKEAQPKKETAVSRSAQRRETAQKK